MINTTVYIQGKTTSPFPQQISQIRDEQGNEVERAVSGQLVTFLVSGKVRKNDVVMIAG